MRIKGRGKWARHALPSGHDTTTAAVEAAFLHGNLSISWPSLACSTRPLVHKASLSQDVPRYQAGTSRSPCKIHSPKNPPPSDQQDQRAVGKPAEWRAESALQADVLGRS
jgi:hypothetical protein